jgi:hypothetical protein
MIAFIKTTITLWFPVLRIMKFMNATQAQILRANSMKILSEWI